MTPSRYLMARRSCGRIIAFRERRAPEFHKDLHIPHAQLVLRKGYHHEINSYSAFFENDRETRYRPCRLSPRAWFCAGVPGWSGIRFLRSLLGGGRHEHGVRCGGYRGRVPRHRYRWYGRQDAPAIDGSWRELCFEQRDHVGQAMPYRDNDDLQSRSGGICRHMRRTSIPRGIQPRICCARWRSPTGRSGASHRLGRSQALLRENRRAVGSQIAVTGASELG